MKETEHDDLGAEDGAHLLGPDAKPLEDSKATILRRGIKHAVGKSVHATVMNLDFWQAAATIALVFIGVFQYKIYKLQAEIQQAQLRARFTHAEPQMFPLDKDGVQVAKDSAEIANWSVSPSWKNVGGTPAQHFLMTYVLEIHQRHSGFDPETLVNECPSLVHDRMDAPGSTIAQGEAREPPGKNLAMDVAKGAQLGTYTILYATDVVYEDIFKKPHEAATCVWLNVTNAQKSVFSFVVLKETAD